MSTCHYNYISKSFCTFDVIRWLPSASGCSLGADLDLSNCLVSFFSNKSLIIVSSVGLSTIRVTTLKFDFAVKTLLVQFEWASPCWHVVYSNFCIYVHEYISICIKILACTRAYDMILPCASYSYIARWWVPSYMQPAVMTTIGEYFSENEEEYEGN